MFDEVEYEEREDREAEEWCNDQRTAGEMWCQSTCNSQDRKVQTFNKLMQTHKELHK
jgi:hypothetical protein